MHYASNTIIMHRNVTKVATNYMAMPPPPKISIQQNSKAQYEVGKQHTSDVGEYTQNGSFVMMGDRKEAPRLLKHSLN